VDLFIAHTAQDVFAYALLLIQSILINSYDEVIWIRKKALSKQLKT
jgi:hypothetical protein